MVCIKLQFLVKGGIGELRLGDTVLVVERDRRAVLDRLAEIVDADVVAEDLPCLLLPGHERRAGKPDERRVRQRVTMFIAKMSYWLRCALSVITMISGR